MNNSLTTAAENAYNNYSNATGGKTFDGRDMPHWDQLPWKIQDAWRRAVSDFFLEVWNLEDRIYELEDKNAELSARILELEEQVGLEAISRVEGRAFGWRDV